MRHYIPILKSLQCSSILKTTLEDIEGVPEEALRMLRAQEGVSFSILPHCAHFWIVDENTREILRTMEDFTGTYKVGLDEIGYYWELA